MGGKLSYISLRQGTPGLAFQFGEAVAGLLFQPYRRDRSRKGRRRDGENDRRKADDHWYQKHKGSFIGSRFSLGNAFRHKRRKHIGRH